jgi:hypothetical protein
MSNGSEACCAIGICCPAASVQRRNAVIKIMTDDGCDGAQAAMAADAILSRLALAPLSFQAVIDDLMHHAKKHFASGV